LDNTKPKSKKKKEKKKNVESLSQKQAKIFIKIIEKMGGSALWLKDIVFKTRWIKNSKSFLSIPPLH